VLNPHNRTRIAPGQLDDNNTDWLGVAEIKVMYIQDQGQDWLALHITEPDGHHVIVPVPPSGAAYIAKALTGMLDNLGELRSEWVATNGGKA
jgi:hypothetical protein